MTGRSAGREQNYYEVLGIDRDATASQIDEAWKLNLAAWHPDKFQGDMKEQAQQRTVLINQARSVLADKTERAEYDRQIEMRAAQERKQPAASREHARPDTSRAVRSPRSEIGNVTYGDDRIGPAEVLEKLRDWAKSGPIHVRPFVSPQVFKRVESVSIERLTWANLTSLVESRLESAATYPRSAFNRLQGVDVPIDQVSTPAATQLKESTYSAYSKGTESGRNCRSCGGKGKVKCNSCANGFRSVSHTTPEGKTVRDKVRCTVCRGEGEISCSGECKGEGSVVDVTLYTIQRQLNERTVTDVDASDWKPRKDEMTWQGPYSGLGVPGGLTDEIRPQVSSLVSTRLTGELLRELSIGTVQAQRVQYHAEGGQREGLIVENSGRISAAPPGLRKRQIIAIVVLVVIVAAIVLGVSVLS